tara:strand:- start:570 stop:995 length:426 start_codon:yes stop_codon:yes gene_type:complete
MDINKNNIDKIAIEGISESTLMSQIFLSKKNIDLIQIKIINIINNQYKYKISKQSKNELIIIMRSIYLNNATNNYKDKTIFKNELKHLNDLVINYCVKNIVNNIRSHELYLKKINNDLIPMNLPTTTNIKGDKQLELKSFF